MAPLLESERVRVRTWVRVRRASGEVVAPEPRLLEEVVKDIARAPRGAFALVGPPCSGRSTALAALRTTLADRERPALLDEPHRGDVITVGRSAPVLYTVRSTGDRVFPGTARAAGPGITR